MTLPERTLRHLRSLDADLAHAVVKAVEIAVPGRDAVGRGVEVVEVAKGAAVILVPPSDRLRSIPWLRLAEVSPGRHLLTIVPGTPVESLEVTLLDAIETLQPAEERERALLESLLELVRARRRSEDISKFEMLYVSPTGGERR